VLGFENDVTVGQRDIANDMAPSVEPSLCDGEHASCQSAPLSESSRAMLQVSTIQTHAQEVEAKLVSVAGNMWNATVARFMQHEIEMPKSGPKVDKTIYVALGMVFGLCGCDRCFMGQICCGMIKGFSFGGLLLWWLIDYVLCIYIALSKAPNISTMGYSADFEPSTIDNAFWLCVCLIIGNACTQTYGTNSAREQYNEQKEQYEELAALYQKKHQGSDLIPFDVLVPGSDQALAYAPEVFIRALRKAGMISGKVTLPEMCNVFAQLDKNGDGQLDRGEIADAIVRLGATTDTDVDAVLKQCDTNGDGNISTKEFLEQFFVYRRSQLS
jgi:hypothetical protein